MKVFESKQNTIEEYEYKGEPCYIVRAVNTPVTAVFNRNEAVLTALMEKLSDSRCGLYSSKTGKNFGFFYSDKSDTGTLARFLYRLYHPDTEITGIIKRVSRDNDSSLDDCRSCNLVQTGTYATETLCRKIDVIEIGGQRYIHLFMKKRGCSFYFDYSEGLYNILSNPSQITFDVGCHGHIRCYLGKERVFVYGHRLAYYYYHGLIDADDIVNSVQLATVQMTGMTIDHLNSDGRNNCSYNLSAITKAQNCVKSNSTGKMNQNCRMYTAVTDSGEYRVKIDSYGVFNGYFRFGGIDLLNNGLQNFLGRTGSLFSGTKVNLLSGENAMSDAPYLLRTSKAVKDRDFITDTLEALRLLSMPSDAFFNWKLIEKTAGNGEAVANMIVAMLS